MLEIATFRALRERAARWRERRHQRRRVKDIRAACNACQGSEYLCTITEQYAGSAGCALDTDRAFNACWPDDAD